jgi:periplasmic protein TonB
MLAYAPRPERRRLHPGALAVIVGLHAAAIVAVMSARMDFEPPWKADKTDVTLVPLPPEPAEVPPEPDQRVPAPQPRLDNPPTPLPPLPSDGPVADPVPFPIPDPGPSVGPSLDPGPTPAIIRTGPRFNTPDHLLKPPYPEDKRRLDQEATLKLHLAIDASGRVTAVEPVGKTDPAFLQAARSHILKAWRYKPATEDGRAIASSTVITLKFELD